MRYCFHPAAEVELSDAVDYYNECQEGLMQLNRIPDYWSQRKA